MKLTRQAVLRQIAEEESPLHFAGLLRAFGGRHIRHELKRLVEEMAADGEIVRLRGNSYTLPEKSVTIRGTISMHRDGYGFVTPAGGGEDIFIPSRMTRGAMHGDTVEVIPRRSRLGGSRREGDVTAVVERSVSRIVGRFEENRRGAIVIPDDIRLHIPIAVSPKAKGKALDGQQVVVELLSYPAGGRPAEGKIVEVLGWPDDPEVEVQSVIRRFDLPHRFSKEAMNAAGSVPSDVSADDLRGRTDLRHLPVVTIDGETARDFDDAVSLQREGANFRLRVSIADVSHYVKTGSPLDRDAYLRGTSVYFPDRCIPMLPERLSNGICSLNPSVNRLTMTSEMLFSSAGEMLDSRFYPSVIKSDARLTYTTVRNLIEDGVTDDSLTPPLAAMLLEMKELALVLMDKRKKRGSIDFDLPEPEIIIGLTGKTESIIRAERNLAHQLIEEFMLAANEAVAAFVTAKNLPFLYRIHEQPDAAKLHGFRELAIGYGYAFPMEGDRVNPAELQRLISEAEGKPEERLINYSLLRCMKQARYASENPGHFGLASACYCHFTSPIRRYPDLVVHRILKDALAGRKSTFAVARQEKIDGRAAPAVDGLAAIAEHTSRRERVAMEAERDIVEIKKLQYMQQHVGGEFSGFIAGVAGFGFFVELEELFVEGLVHVSTLADDIYNFVEQRHLLLGSHTRRSFRLGDRVKVKVAAVNPGTRRIEFILTGHEPQAVPLPANTPVVPEYPRLPVKGKRLPLKQGKGGKASPKRRK